MKYIIILLIVFSLFSSCHQKQEINSYLISIDKELSALKDEPKKVLDLYEREILQYNKTKEEKFFLSSKYLETAIINQRFKKIAALYNLQKLGSDHYDFITIVTNYHLAAEFEKTSPKWAHECMDKAISIAEKTKEHQYLPHLYHFKGRLFYNSGDYYQALSLFRKALDIFTIQKNNLYISSMHNNFGMCYYKMNKVNLAIEEVKTAIKIILPYTTNSKKNQIFLAYLKTFYAEYETHKKNYTKAERLLQEVLNYSLQNKQYPMALSAAKNLIFLFKNTQQSEKILVIAKSLPIIEPHLTDPKHKITINILAQELYFNQKNFKNLGIVSQKLINLNEEENKYSDKILRANLDITDNFVVNNIKMQHDTERQKNHILVFATTMALIIFIIFIIYLTRKAKRREKLHNYNNLEAQNQKKILLQDIENQKEKIRNLHLNLNLKSESEKAFLENLKKLKKSKNGDSEELVKDLQFKISNLIHIDKKNNELTIESSKENKLFMENLSKKYPQLSIQEIKLCVYFRLNLSAKEISLLENFTVGSIRVYKTKIKAKIGLPKETDLDTFLSKFNPI